MTRTLRKDAGLAAGIDHPDYTVAIANVPTAVRASLAADLTA